MKLSSYVADFIARQGIRHVFAITGGASIHLIHSIADHPDVDYICPQHEQAGAMAADAYSRVTGNLGCAIATSGPGATNLITGIASAWFDSVPVLYITGQVTTFRLKGDTGVRQLGFQETEIVGMVKPITKYAVMVRHPARIRYELEKAVWIAKSGRPGPVVVDLPDDLQRTDIDPRGLDRFVPPKPAPGEVQPFDVERCIDMLARAQRPVLVVGWGAKLAGAAAEIRELAERLQFPICPSWGALDLFPADHPLSVGGFGTHGTRYGNFAVQNSDLILAIGAKLSTRETGSPMSTFARGAKTIIVDIDPAELNKFPRFGRKLDLPIVADAKAFATTLLGRLNNFAGADIEPWRQRVREWKVRYPICPPALRDEKAVNPYVFVDELSKALADGDTIFVDTGCAIAWMMQGFRFKPKQRIFHAFNNTPMGWALPAAIGGSFALDKGRVICVAGDGAMMMNIQELCTASRHELPIKLFLINNNGHSMVQQTEEEWLGGVNHATTPETGLAFPDWHEMARACGWGATRIDLNQSIAPGIVETLESKGPVLCDVIVPAGHRVIPKCKYGYPNEDSEPLLPRDEFLANMIVPPMEVSL